MITDNEKFVQKLARLATICEKTGIASEIARAVYFRMALKCFGRIPENCL